ncbi:MAG: DUF4160 domain-containing protein [Proteobacteria bacterium]|nr:DUF4160 domain-containing protein [Pseudomonadota bacterium]
MKLVILPQASLELQEAVEYYEAEQSGLGERLFFYSREEPRIHVHVGSPNGEAKFWIEPTVEIASNHGLKDVELIELKQLIEERQNEIREHWNRHFGN